MEIEKVLEKALKLVKPSEKNERKLQRKVEKFLAKLDTKLVGCVALPGGSFAKGTWIKDIHDIDIFVMFPKKLTSRNISDLLEKMIRKAFFFVKRIPASRDYFQVKKYGYLFEIVPVLKISTPQEAGNIMDVSPLHVKFVCEAIQKNPKLQDEIRLAKAFCKAANCYGAESYIRGFSGYVLELLTIKYGGFLNLVKAASKWRELSVITFNKKRDVLKFLNPSKISPLIVIDPIQPGRNAAAALSKEKFLKFKEHCIKFLENPSIEFFEKKIKIPEKSIVIEAKPIKARKDIAGCNLVRAFNFIKSKLKDLIVIDSGWYWPNKNALFWYKVVRRELPEFVVHIGPPLKEEYHVERFKEKWHDHEIFEKQGRICVKIPRKYRTIKEYLKKEVFRGEFLKDKVRKLKIKKLL